MKVFFITKEFKKNKIRKAKAFGLVELMISIALIAIVITGTIAVIVQAFITIVTVNQKSRAQELIQEQSGALTEYKKSNWSGIRSHTGTNGSNPKYLNFIATTTLADTTNVNNSTTININLGTDLKVGDSISLSLYQNTYARIVSMPSNTQIILDKPLGDGSSQNIIRYQTYRIKDGHTQINNSGTTYDLNFTLDKGLRSNSGCSSYGNLDNSSNGSCTYTVDNHYIWVTFTASWQDLTNKTQKASFQTYINDWDNSSNVSKTYADFSSGAQLSNVSVVDNSGTGNIKLANNGSSYFSTGTYISQIIDGGSNNQNYFSLDFTSDLPSGTSINVSFRVAGTKGSIISSAWTNVDVNCYSIPPTASPDLKRQCNLYEVAGNPFAGNQYYQIQLILNTTDTAITPLIKFMQTFYQ